MFKTPFLAVMATLFSFSTYASCKVAHYEFFVTISEATFDASYDYDDSEIQLGEGDFAEVKDLNDGSVSRFDLGSFTNDGAGNFEFKAISSEEATYFEVFHDHETWDTGLEGYFTKPDGSMIELSSVKDCSYEKLFN